MQEVESIANPMDCESVNKDNMTPREVFAKDHKEMLKEVETSMKDTTTSCTVLGALIITIMFAATFIVPGGNDTKTSFPKDYWDAEDRDNKAVHQQQEHEAVDGPPRQMHKKPLFRVSAVSKTLRILVKCPSFAALHAQIAQFTATSLSSSFLFK
ncbi:hypothetical protein ACFX13_024487 [Malus domestica]